MKRLNFILAGFLVIAAMASLAHAATSEIPPPPENIYIRQKDVAALLRWEKPSIKNFAGFRIYRSEETNKLGTLIKTVNKISFSFLDSTVAKDATYFYTVRTIDKNRNESNNEQQFSIKIADAGQKSFIYTLIDKLPNTYIITEGEYSKSIGSDPQKAIIIKPCQADKDPTYFPVCFTELTILEEDGKTKNLDEYIKKDDFLNSYESYSGKKLIQTTYQGNIPLVYMPNASMCSGSGGETCVEQIFIYHLADGRNIRAGISFWLFNKGKFVKKPVKKVQKIINIYKNALTK